MTAKALTLSSLLVSSGIVFKPGSGGGEGPTLVDPNYPEYRVSFGHLEAYLQSVRKEIYDQKCELQLCVSELLYKQEVAQRTELQQRVETCLMDLNLVKDLVYQNSQASPSSYAGHTQAGDKTLLLKGEIENLKCVMRRFELQQVLLYSIHILPSHTVLYLQLCLINHFMYVSYITPLFLYTLIRALFSPLLL